MTVHMSAVVTTRNRPTFLARALSSIAGQCSDFCEIIVVDDASENGSEVARIAASFGARSLRSDFCKGASAARNLGARVARGRVLAFLDDDDEWLPQYVTAVMRAFRDQNADVAACGFIRQTNGRDTPEKNAPATLVFEHFLVRNPGIRASNLSIRREIFLDIGGFDETLPCMNDMDFGARLALTSLRYVPIVERLVRYIDHDQPRLSVPGTTDKALGIRRFYERYEAAMTERQRIFFRTKMSAMWEVILNA